MTSISAFVGHSFSEEDEALVTKIVTCLDQVAEIHPGFTWVRAKRPEPISVNEKVLALIEGRDLFIGICTRKEYAVKPSALSTTWWGRRRSSVHQSEFIWKTSDWIIQEIGLAIGRGMKIILLIEDGVRPPGQLQGNLEYIPLSRDAPEKSFLVLLGMLTSLLGGKTVQPSEQQKISPSQSAGDDADAPDQEANWNTPRDDWTKHDYEFGMLHAIATDDQPSKLAIDEKFLSSDIGSSVESRAEWEALKEYMSIRFGRGGDVTKLEALTSQHPSNGKVMGYLAKAYQRYEEHQRAGQILKSAADISALAEDKIKLLGEAAVSYQKAGRSADADEVMAQLHQISRDSGEGEVAVLAAEKNLAEQRKDHHYEIATQERLLQLNPSDDEVRFSLAYKYSTIGREDVAAYHYSRIPSNGRSATAWNNLGAALESLKLPIKAVKAYRASIDLGETLAMANLASRFRRAGFAREAEELLQQASKIEDHHKNVEHGFASLRDDQEAEEREVETAQQKAKVVSDFYRRYGEALCKPLSANLAGTWKAPKCNVTLQITGNQVLAEGSYDAPVGLMSAVFAHGGLVATTTRHTVKYQGTLRGCGVVGTIVRQKEGEKTPASALLAIDNNPTFLMWIDDSLAELHVMEISQSNEPTCYSLLRA